MNESIGLAKLKVVIHSLNADKIPRPDGLPIEFYIGFMEIMENYLLVIIKESKIKDMIHMSFNSTFIALIPKKDKAMSLDDFR